MNKTDLIQKIKQLEGISQDERAYLINLVNTKKKYGLVWEDKPEDAEEQLRTHLPVLREVKEKRITAPPQPSPEGREQEASPVNQPQTTASPNLPENRDKLSEGGEKEASQRIKALVKNAQTSLFEPETIEQSGSEASPLGVGLEGAVNHILIEGDNLHALTALTFTHEGKIDVIYIDPPYNTGNKDFKYNDSFVDKEDSYRHSKWLSFMGKRLRMAKRLLSEKGVIFISIDDNEQAQLKMLCDEVLGEDRFIRSVIWHKKYAAASDSKGIPDMHDFVLVYGKTDSFTRNLLPRTGKQDDLYKYDSHDGKGLWRSDNLSVKTYNESYDFDLVNPNTGIVYRPPRGRAWITNKDRIAEWIGEGRIFFGQKGDGAPQLKRYLKEVQAGVVPTSYWGYDEVGHNDSSRKELKEILFERADGGFSTPKPTALIKRALIISSLRSSIILDFFAGSGTTLHATMQLNSEDGGTRQCILVTNNENNICEEVTYERNRRVIQGYTNSKGEWVNGLTNNNLRYYKSEFVPSHKTEPNKRLLTQTSTDLLCIKEDCYTELTETAGFEPLKCRIFTNDRGKYLMVVYHNRKQLQVCEQLIGYIQTISNLSENIKLYAFSPEKETLLEDFAEVADIIDAVPLPEAIYNAYRATFRTLKLDKKPITTTYDRETNDVEKE